MMSAQDFYFSFIVVDICERGEGNYISINMRNTKLKLVTKNTRSKTLFQINSSSPVGSAN